MYGGTNCSVLNGEVFLFQIEALIAKAHQDLRSCIILKVLVHTNEVIVSTLKMFPLHSRFPRSPGKLVLGGKSGIGLMATYPVSYTAPWERVGIILSNVNQFITCHWLLSPCFLLLDVESGFAY
jgi:hypothetical protein